jgi:hypothetical protein
VSRRAAAWLLWLAAALALPVPYYLGEIESAPLLRLGFITGIYAAVLMAEGARGMTGLFVGLGLAQLLLWALLLRLAAGLIARLLARVPSPRARAAASFALAGLMLAAGVTPLYDTPLSSSRSRSNLFQLFE